MNDWSQNVLRRKFFVSKRLLHQIPVVVFLLLLLPLIWASVNVTTFMLYVLPLFHHKIPHLFFYLFVFLKTSVKEKNKALTVSAFTHLFTVHQQSRCPTEIVMADWSLLFTGLNLIQMESPLGFTPTKFLRIWLKRKLPGSVGKLHDYEEVSCGPHRLGFQAPFAVESGGCGESLDS